MAATREPNNGALYALTIFLSAFLLFEVQPLVAKEILPWFGGSAGVWTTCMLFFQLLLLGGYAYAHWLSRGRHRWVHVVVLVAGVLMFRIVPTDWWKPLDGKDPVWRILCLLSATVGLPYFTLASTGPLLQSWYARQHRAGVPYRLFALSNVASMLALLSYPIVIEPRMRLHTQAWVWSVVFLIFAALNFGLFRQSAFYPAYGEDQTPTPYAPLRTHRRVLWVLLSACASALLLAVTNHITQNIAAIPLLWILPLGVYLLSFILTFENTRWYPRRSFLPLFALALGVMGYAADPRSDVYDIRVLVPVFIGGLFICCMVCHGELARSKPSARWLTSFYLMVALGGAVGGLFVAVVAPAVFPALVEFPLLLVVTPAVILGLLLLDHQGSLEAPAASETLMSRRWKGVTTAFSRAPFWPMWSLSLVGVVGLGGYLAQGEWADLSEARLLSRNFYGALRVQDDDELGVRELAHGTVSHGEQYLDREKRRRPLTYYAADTGIGLLMTEVDKKRAIRLGVVGLGTGSMAAWGRAGDAIRFYEINARVLDIARTQFTFLADCASHTEVVLGDARLSLEREAPQQFDVLVVDAFSGDSIPVHLLTREAFQVYFRHLTPDGILAVHVSNSYLDLAPSIAALARQLGREAHLIVNEEDLTTRTFSADWILVGDNESERFPWIKAKESEITLKPDLRVWTDDFSNLWQVLTL
ncbi:MAG: fused MFS/spermidine synthase [Steroidobacteraceae bacterium]|jgi:spermidine synthase